MAVLQRLCLAFAKLLRYAEDEMVTENITEDKIILIEVNQETHPQLVLFLKKKYSYQPLRKQKISSLQFGAQNLRTFLTVLRAGALEVSSQFYYRRRASSARTISFSSQS